MTKPNSINNIQLEVLESIAKTKGPKDRPGPKQEKEEQLTSRQTRFNSQLDKLKQRARASAERKQSEAEARVLQAVLPMWDDANRGVPNPFIRSGLFSVKNTVNRQFLQDIEIASLSNYDVRYTGQELQQDDLSVWMSLINLARSQPINDMVLFTGYSLIKDLGWRMHTDSYKRVQESIQRLKVTGLEISTNDRESAYSGSLIREYAWTEKDAEGNARWMVRFEQRVSNLFMDDTTTLLEWETRKKIGTRATLAQWLHSFYSSHREPIPLAVAKLHELSRSGDNLSSFRRNIRNALAKLVDVGFLKTFHIVSDTVHVQRIFGKSVIKLPIKPKT